MNKGSERLGRLSMLTQQALESASECVILVGSKASIHHANKETSILLGYDSRELLSKKLFEISDDFNEDNWQNIWEKAKERGTFNQLCRFKSKDGQVLREEANASFLQMDGIDYLCLFIKPEAKKVLDFEAFSSREHLDNIINSMNDLIFVKDREHRWVLMNEAFGKAIGKTREELIGKSDYDFFPKHEADVFWEKDELVFKTGKENVNEEEFTDAEGNTMIILTKKTLYLDTKRDKFIVGVARDITGRKMMEQKLKQTLKQIRRLSLRDDLTKLYNRRGFTTLANQQIKLADRKQAQLMLLFADLDNMKMINDELGHQEGDQALVDVAHILTESFRSSDIIARIGGDEFVVLAIDAGLPDAEVLIANLQNNLDKYNTLREPRYKLFLSIGMAPYNPKIPCSIEELLTVADQKMYEKKREKKNQ